MKTWQNWLWILAAGMAWIYLVFALHGRTWAPHQIAGVAIMTAAYLPWALARVQLGSSFAVSPQAKALVTRGLYSKIQNPVYVFNAIFYAGFFVFFGRPAWVLFFLVLIPLQMVRIREERKVLEAKFGEAYREYRKSTWF